MSLAAGTRLAHYEIHAPLGAGGMGEVYRARDVRLGRDVAIKILPLKLSADSEVGRRFQREAKIIASLNHPNICTVYDVGIHDDLSFIVMECLEGETLESRLKKGRLPTEQVLRYASQIANALHKAHQKGVIHRDVKPGNIMLTKSGAKLLDFGLATSTVQRTTPDTVTSSIPPSSITQVGTLLGTFPYMSPEQIQGKEVDSRSDIFSFGAVIYEMTTNRRAFEGKDYLSLATAILEKEPPPVSVVAPSTPVHLDHAIRRCLAKDPEERWQSAKDLACELEWIGESLQPQSSAGSLFSGKKLWLAIVAVVCLLAAILTAVRLASHSQGGAGQESFFLAAMPFIGHDVTFSPNGHTFAAVGLSESESINRLWLDEIGKKDQRVLPETDGASFPFWSPDGGTLAFFADGKLKKIEIATGLVQVICNAPAGRGGTWNKDGVIVFSPSGQLSGGLYRVSSNGGTATRISQPDASRGENTHRWPAFLPDGRHFLYLAASYSGNEKLDAIFVAQLGATESHFVTYATGNPAYVAPGFLLFCRGTTLYAQRFDAGKLATVGEAEPILANVSYQPRIFRNEFASSDTGDLVAQTGVMVSLSRLVWRDRKGQEIGVVDAPEVDANPALAPNGKWIALDKTDQQSQNSDLWIFDIPGGSNKRFTFNPAIDAAPVWSSDGKKILFASSRTGLFQLYIKNADGAEEEKLVALDVADNADKYPNSWSADGKHILYERTTDATKLWVADLSDLNTHPLLKGTETDKGGQFSPDGKWVAYTSNESGKWEVFATSFPDARGKWQVSNGGGTQPRWRGDGKELYYLSSSGKMMAAPVRSGDRFEAGPPQDLFQANVRAQVAGSELVTYDVAKDGQKFLINTQVRNPESEPLSVILNWPAAFKK